MEYWDIYDDFWYSNGAVLHDGIVNLRAAMVYTTLN